MPKEFWAGRKVFITGHTGFKGSWLTFWLQSLGADVTGYSLAPPTTPALFDILDISASMNCDVRGDVRNAEAMRDAIAHAQPEVVFHLAAQPLVRASYEAPIETFDTNVMGTVNLLEAVRTCQTVRSVVVVTTDKCYQNNEWQWAYRENEALGGHDPYSASKACAEMVSAAYRSSYFSIKGSPNVATARAGNVIGGGDYAQDRLIVDIVHALIEGKPVKIRNPHAVRPWQHVLEPLNGYLMLARSLYQDSSFARAWNFGPAESDAMPVSWICDQLTTMWGNSSCWIKDDGEHVHEASYLKLDSSQARAILGWKPRLSLTQALEWIVEWNRIARVGGDLRRRTQFEIEQYQALGKTDD